MTHSKGDHHPFEDLKKLFENSNETINQESERWLTSVRDKLYSMFCSPMKEEYTHEAFKWVAQLCLSIGDFSWISPNDQWTQEEAKIFSCIARLSLAEIHILLPLIERHLTCGDESDMEYGKVLARSANADDYDRFGNHLIIIESVIKSLVRNQELDDNDEELANPLADSIKADDLKSLLERLKETMQLIAEYLESVHKYWTKLVELETNSEKFLSAEGALRLMSVWLSEDPGSFEPQCKRYLIDLIVKYILKNEQSSRNDLHALALHSICTNTDDMKQVLRKIPHYKEALEKYLSYVQKEQNKSTTKEASGSQSKRVEKMFKLRCGLIKDLML